MFRWAGLECSEAYSGDFRVTLVLAVAPPQAKDGRRKGGIGPTGLPPAFLLTVRLPIQIAFTHNSSDSLRHDFCGGSQGRGEGGQRLQGKSDVGAGDLLLLSHALHDSGSSVSHWPLHVTLLCLFRALTLPLPVYASDLVATLSPSF